MLNNTIMIFLFVCLSMLGQFFKVFKWRHHYWDFTKFLNDQIRYSKSTRKLWEVIEQAVQCKAPSGVCTYIKVIPLAPQNQGHCNTLVSTHPDSVRGWPTNGLNKKKMMDHHINTKDVWCRDLSCCTILTVGTRPPTPITIHAAIVCTHWLNAGFPAWLLNRIQSLTTSASEGSPPFLTRPFLQCGTALF